MIGYNKYIGAILLIVLFFFSSCVSGDGSFPLSLLPKEEKTVVGMQPYGAFPSDWIDTLKRTISEQYGFEVVVLPSKKLPKSAYTTVKSPRYRADSLIAMMKRDRPDSVDYVLGLTGVDISTTKRDENGDIKKPVSRYSDWGIFGLGYRPGPSCIVSSFRLKTSNKKQTLERLRKVCLHELGHNMGLPHCKDSDVCVMQDANESIKTVDTGSEKLCSSCKGKI